MGAAVRFEIEAQDGEARAGVLTTRRGTIETPVFMPVGTAGTVKGIRFDELAPGKASHEETERSMNLTARWANRSKIAFERLQTEGADAGRVEAEGLSGQQALFGIIQGAGHLDLRRVSLEQTVDIGFDG